MQTIKQIIALFFHHSYTDDVCRCVHKWLSQPSFAQEKDEALQELWNTLDVPADASTLQSLQAFRRKIKQHAAARRLRLWIIRAAAIIVVPIAAVTSIHFYLTKDQPLTPVVVQEAKMTDHFVPNGKLLKITLSDGSTVSVNSGSHIRYPKKFSGNTRTVYLSGQANFQVKQDKQRPFIVQTDYFQVEALGTVFDVCSYKQNDQVSTSLLSGMVRIDFTSPDDDGNSQESIILTPNTQMVYDCEARQVHINQVEKEDISAWQKGSLVFQDATLNDIKTALEYKYDVKIYYTSGKYDREIFTVKFIHQESLADCLRILQYIIPDFNYKIQNNEIFIY